MSPRKLVLDGQNLRLADLIDLEKCQPKLKGSATDMMRDAVATLRKIVDEGRVCYGVNTGFGAFANRRIERDAVEQLQYNLVRSHACGVGDPLPNDIVRRAMILKANTLAAGHSGARPQLAETLLAFVEHDVIPVIPSRGSVAASGDLAPLAHLSLALIGEGEAVQAGAKLVGSEVLSAAQCQPIKLEAKEGLAMINGTQISTALALKGLYQAERLLRASITAGALSVEALAGSFVPFDERIHAVSRLEGQQRIARQFRQFLTNSEINDAHADCDRVQDPYSLRCMPQVFGGVWDTLHHAGEILGRQINAITDNPLIFGEDVLSGGNFHAESPGFACDFMSIAVAELGSISERRTDLLERQINPDLNMFLTTEPGLESGYMIAHVTATALVSENKTLAHPATVDSLPTSAGQEDHVSMAAWAGMKLNQICNNVAYVVAIELIAAAHAIDKLRPLHTTPALEEIHSWLREKISFDPKDHRHDVEIEAVAAAISRGDFDRFMTDSELTDAFQR
ncbi:MAG: histidine ammonia-lyase [Gammaproteobacteria bacterium]|nr:histidine ammonia-lyase [Gammaproteobacteria bacterium]MDH3768633.1 histidine ammonia-lyase [Gammaproteobacteria bacterium]